MEFTKEQIETAKKVYVQYATDKYNVEISTSYIHYLDSLLKPERKKIIVEIEYDVAEDYNQIGIDHITRCINDDKYHIANCINPKVKQLPEVFTRENLYDIFDPSFLNKNYIDGKIDKWLLERKQK